ncbi:MAG: hypothetical protein NZ581_08270 [Candidatus Caldarchaeum sp.]|nr:hypothetical protein [Candidatus Caldarchaeum sp.]MDW8436168.1 hypothetical protein [Candidatus Caldarchaeum sp.]
MALLDRDIAKLDAVSAKSIFDEIINFFSKKLTPRFSNKKVGVVDVDFKLLVNTLLNLSTYLYISETINRSSLNRLSDGSIDAMGLQEFFTRVYSELGLLLNSRFLSRDVQVLSENQPFPSDDENRRDEAKKRGEEVRNFFAHSGLLKNQNTIKLENGKIYVKYGDKFKGTVRRWLEDPG